MRCARHTAVLGWAQGRHRLPQHAVVVAEPQEPVVLQRQVCLRHRFAALVGRCALSAALGLTYARARLCTRGHAGMNMVWPLSLIMQVGCRCAPAPGWSSLASPPAGYDQQQRHGDCHAAPVHQGAARAESVAHRAMPRDDRRRLAQRACCTSRSTSTTPSTTRESGSPGEMRRGASRAG